MDKLSIGDMEKISFDTADLANQAIDAWRAAETRQRKKAQK